MSVAMSWLKFKDGDEFQDAQWSLCHEEAQAGLEGLRGTRKLPLLSSEIVPDLLMRNLGPREER